MKLPILVIALILVWPSPSSARTYYVSPIGRDTHSGFETAPLRTIQRAADLVVPGDTVIVEDGIYTGTGLGTRCSTSIRPVVCLTQGGTPDARITFRARTVGGAKIDGQTGLSTEGFYFRKGVNFVTLDGFEIYGMGVPPFATDGGAHGVMLQHGHDVVLSRLHIHHIGRGCTATHNGLSGVFVAQPRVTITRSVFHDIGRYAHLENGCTVDTAGSRDHGIYVSGEYVDSSIPGASDLTITNNIFYGTRRGWGIQIYPGTVSNVSILHNTFSDSNPDQDGQIVIAADITDGRIINNIFNEPRRAAIRFYSGTYRNLTISHNISSSGLSQTAPAGVTFTDNRPFTDPQLVNPPLDVTPASTSPAVDAALPLAEVTIDHGGTRRTHGSAADIGALELVRGSRTSPDPLARRDHRTKASAAKPRRVVSRK